MALFDLRIGVAHDGTHIIIDVPAANYDMFDRGRVNIHISAPERPTMDIEYDGSSAINKSWADKVDSLKSQLKERNISYLDQKIEDLQDQLSYAIEKRERIESEN